MFYLHEPVEFAHIGEGSRITFDMGSAKVRCTCPGCGVEVMADADDLYERLVLTEDNESAYCPSCSKKLQAERSAELKKMEEES